MHAFEYASPTTVKEAVALLGGSWKDAQVLAGGTDLLNLMKDYVETPTRVVNIKGIKELSGISTSGSGVRIGALATFEDILNAQALRDYPAIVTAVRGVASPQIRNMGTAAGDLCQRPRCWYYRNGFGLLAQQNGKSLVVDGENRYHAIFGAGPAYFVSASSLGPALIALGATIKVASAKGNRDIPADQFFQVPATAEAREIALQPGEIITDIAIPGAAGAKNATYEVRERDMLDWPLATASVSLRQDGGARVVLGHVAPKPWVATEAENFLNGKTISEDVAAKAGEAAVAGAKTLSENAYKVQLAKVCVKRALLAAAGKQVA